MESFFEKNWALEIVAWLVSFTVLGYTSYIALWLMVG